jgi:hypothetical protein
MGTMAVGCDLGLRLLKRAVEAGLALTTAEEGKLTVWGPVDTVDRQLLLDLKQNKPAVIRTLRHGERLLRALWRAGYRVRIEKGHSGKLFLLPTGNPQLTKEHWEALFADYEAHHDAGLWTLLGRLPKTPAGEPDWRWWNETSQTFRIAEEWASGLSTDSGM